LLVAVCVLACYAFETEDDVIVGTEANFDDVLKANQFVLVEFYAPWCGHCKTLAPEYAKAAGILKDAPVKLVKVDATIHAKVAEKYGVQGYPTLKFFKNGEASEFTGGRTAKDIVAWLNKKSGPAAANVDTVDAAKTLAASNEAVAIGFFAADSEESQAFLDAAGQSDNVFATTTSADVAAHYGVTIPAVIVLKKFDEGRTDFTGKFTPEEINVFVAGNQLPYVIEFSDANAPKIFGGAIKTHILLFVDKSDAKYEEYVNAMKAVAKNKQGKLLFVVVDSSQPDHQRIVEFFGIPASDLPAVRLIDIANEMAKFKPESKAITAEVLQKFADDFLSGNLKKHLMSEATPADWDAKPVKILTGENFANVALDASKHVLVEFYAPWCGHCKQLTPIWDQLAENFQSFDNIVVAKMDSTVNEVEGVSIQSFPTIKFYPAGENKQAKDFSGGRDLKSLAQYLMSETGVTVEIAGGAADDDFEDEHDHDGHDHDGHDHDGHDHGDHDHDHHHTDEL
jgi:protein disulfide-isomerase A1